MEQGDMRGNVIALRRKMRPPQPFSPAKIRCAQKSGHDDRSHARSLNVLNHPLMLRFRPALTRIMILFSGLMKRAPTEGKQAMTAPRSILLIGIILLLWNLIGVLAFIMQYSADLSQLAKSDPTTARIFAQMPGWSWAAYAVAVGAGTLGAILLLLRKAAAAPIFLLSIIAIVVQFGHSFLGTDLLAVKGATAAIFPAVILIIAIFQWRYAHNLTARGILH